MGNLGTQSLTHRTNFLFSVYYPGKYAIVINPTSDGQHIYKRSQMSLPLRGEPVHIWGGGGVGLFAKKIARHKICKKKFARATMCKKKMHQGCADLTHIW